MRFCRYVALDSSKAQSATPVFGLIEEENITQISGPPWLPWSRIGRSSRLVDVRLLAPVEPAKIVCVGRNYAAHAAELGNEMPKEPLIFMKPSSSIVGDGDPIVLPRYSQRVEHEGEIAMVIGRRCARLRDSDDALENVLGYTCVNDVTARDLQKSDGQFTRAKGFDTFCPVGPHIETDLNPSDVLVEAYVNGERRQSGSTSLMTYKCDFLIRWLSRMMTLYPGDLISTGTPAGVGPLVAGDTVEVRIAGIGVLRNPVHPPQA
jgi:2-keto-4-pentenoate hydratase/2-oxohepta-3-ene-1,7-dioic acid hydratase in catechol pathway